MARFVLRKLTLQTRMCIQWVRCLLLSDPLSTSIFYVCEQRRLWRDSADAQACLSLRWPPMWYQSLMSWSQLFMKKDMDMLNQGYLYFRQMAYSKPSRILITCKYNGNFYRNIFLILTMHNIVKAVSVFIVICRNRYRNKSAVL